MFIPTNDKSMSYLSNLNLNELIILHGPFRAGKAVEIDDVRKERKKERKKEQA